MMSLIKHALFFLLFSLSVNAQSLFIVHSENNFEGKEKINGYIHALSSAMSKNNKNIYLLSNNPDVGIEGAKTINSGAGEFLLPFEENTVIMTGLYFRACFSNAMEYVITNNRKKEFTIIIPTKMVMIGKNKSLYENWKQNWNDPDHDFVEGYLKPYFATRFPDIQSVRMSGDSIIIRVSKE